jgi:hypothetical protein
MRQGVSVLESAELERVLWRGLREADRRAWEEARSRPIPSVGLEPIDWEDPARRRSAEEASRAYVRLRYLQGEGGGLHPSPGALQRPGGGGSRSLSLSVHKSHRLKWRLRVYPWGTQVRPLGKPQSPPPMPGSRERRSLAGSIRRLVRLTLTLEELDAPPPTHLITLTLAPGAWEELPDDEARLSRWRAALDRFLHALRMRLSRWGEDWAYLFFLEFQQNRSPAAPHLHILARIGELDAEAWREWADWIEEAWKRALGGIRSRTRIEALREPDFRYARAYASKPEQKALPFAGNWGRAYGVAGVWRAYARQVRQAVQFLLDTPSLLLLYAKMALARADMCLGEYGEVQSLGDLEAVREAVVVGPDRVARSPWEAVRVWDWLKRGVVVGRFYWLPKFTGLVVGILDWLAESGHGVVT